MLSPIVYIDIVDKTQDVAEELILDGIKSDGERKSSGYPSYYNLEHFEIDIDYYVEESNITYIKTCTSKVLVGGKDKVHNRITWFADEDIALLTLTEGVKIEYLDLRDTNLNYNVVFDHVLEKSEGIIYRIQAVLTNKHKHFKTSFQRRLLHQS